MNRFFETLKKKLQVWHEERAERIEATRQARLTRRHGKPCR